MAIALLLIGLISNCSTGFKNMATSRSNYHQEPSNHSSGFGWMLGNQQRPSLAYWSKRHSKTSTFENSPHLCLLNGRHGINGIQTNPQLQRQFNYLLILLTKKRKIIIILYNNSCSFPKILACQKLRFCKSKPTGCVPQWAGAAKLPKSLSFNLERI